jgi:hypothetical protein
VRIALVILLVLAAIAFVRAGIIGNGESPISFLRRLVTPNP